MGKLTEDESNALAELLAKRDAPDAPAGAGDEVYVRADGREYKLTGAHAVSALNALFGGDGGTGKGPAKKTAKKAVKKAAPAPVDEDQDDEDEDEDGDEDQEQDEDSGTRKHWFMG